MVNGLSFKEVKKGKMYPESQAYVVELEVKFDRQTSEKSQQLSLFADTASGKSGELVLEQPAEKRTKFANGEVIRVLIPYRWTFGTGAELVFDLSLEGKDGSVLDRTKLELAVPPPPPPPGLP